MLSVVQMIQESQGRAGEREVRRREVGCQWESPEEQRREVGCQSESAERRDAAVQVDLLTQQLSWRHTGVCGVAWQCVSVRADEPGGGALLHHCSTHSANTPDAGQHIHHSPPLYLLCSPLRHTLLPTMPLFGPPAPPDLQQTTSPPPAGGRCEASPLPTPADISPPPPGLIAPLSPRLAEEEEEEGGLLQHELNESFRGNRRSTVTAEKKRKRKSQWSDCSAHGCNMFGVKSRVQPARTARRQRKVDDDKSQPDQHQDVLQSEERSSIRETLSEVNSKTGRGETRQHCRRRGIKTGRPAAQIQRTRAEGGGNATMGKKKKKEEEEEGGQKRSCKEEQKKDEETEQAGRPKRKAVGPPIRYLIESEEQSHGPSVANHSKVKEAQVKRKLWRLRKEHQEEERRGWAELTERTDSSRVESSEGGAVGGGAQLCQVCGLTFTCKSSLQLHLSVHRRWLSCHLCNRKFSCASNLRLHHHHGNPASCHGNGATPSGTRAADDKQDEEVLLPAPANVPDWSRCRQRVRRNPRWWVDYRTTKWRRHDVERWRRQQETDGGRGRKGKRCREEEKEEVKRVCRRKEGGGEEGGRRRDEGEEKEEEKERPTEVKKEVVELPQRPRRKMVGPPIRYLLESEEQSHGPVTANQDRGWGFIIDRPEDTEQTDRQAGQSVTERQTGRTNQDRANGPKQRRGRPKKVVIDNKAGGGASEMTDRSEAAERQRGHMITERQTGHMVTERQTSQTFLERQTGQKLSERRIKRQTGQMVTERQTERQTGQMVTERQTSQTLSERQTERQTGQMVTERQTERQTGQSETERQTGQSVTERQTGQTVTDRQTGQTVTDRQIEIQTGQSVSERQTGLHRQTYLVELQSGQVTVISPCCVRLQRLF